jgi:hypothetical protein
MSRPYTAKTAQTREARDTTREVVWFNLKTTEKTWYSFIVEDQDGHGVVTNPTWTRMVK